MAPAQVAPESKGVITPLAQAAAVGPERKERGENDSIASASTKHPFREKGPMERAVTDFLGSSLAPALVIFGACIGVFVALCHLDIVDDPATAALAVILGFVIFEVLTVRVARVSWVQRFLRPLPSTAASVVLLHGATAWFAAWRFTHADVTVLNQSGLDAARVALLYATLISVAVLGRWSSGAKEWQELQYQAQTPH